MCQPGGQATAIAPTEGQNLSAELRFAPQVLAANQAYSPEYTQLGLQNLGEYLNGTNGSNGYLSLYQNQIAPAATNATIAGNTAVRTANVADVNALIPGMTAATRAANPQAAGLVDTLTGTAQSDLNLGTSLNPAETTQVQQAVRSGQAARGVGTGSGDAMQEALAQADFGQQLYQQRRANAGQAAGQAASLYGGIIPEILGAGANPAVAAGLSATGSGSIAPSMNAEFNPAGGLAGQFMGDSTNASMGNSATRAQGARSFDMFGGS